MDFIAWIIEHLSFYIFIYIGVVLWLIILLTVGYALYLSCEEARLKTRIKIFKRKNLHGHNND
jgi:hypothetical protein